jgi:tetratricopeptide (TPR) repeat protein
MIPYYITLSHIYDHMHQEKRAFAALQDALTIDRSVAEIYIERGNIHKNAGRFEDALKEYNLAVLIKPELWLSHYKAGVALYYLTRLDEAETAFLKAERLYSESGSTYHFLGMVSLARDNNKIAEDRLLKAAELEGTNGDIWYHLGDAQMRTEQWKDAEKSLLKSYDINSYKAETLYSLGQVYKKLGKMDRSIEFLNKFKEIEEFERNTESLIKRIRLHPDDITLRLKLANLYEDQARVDQALMVLRGAVYLGSKEAENKLKTILKNNQP